MYRWQFLKSCDCYKEENNCKYFIFVVYVTGSAVETMQCVKSVQVRSFFWSVFSPNAGKYGQDKTLYLDTFQVVMATIFSESISQGLQCNTGLKWANLELKNRGHSKKWKTSKNHPVISLWKKRWLYSVIFTRFHLNLCMTQSRGVFRTTSKTYCGAYLLK